MKSPLAIVTALPEELAALREVFPGGDVRRHFNTPLYHTRHAGQELVLAQTGVGKVNAACALALLLSDFNPGGVINTGSAGGLQPAHRILDLVVPEEMVYTDVDVTPLGFAYGQMMNEPPRYYADPVLLAHFQAVRAARAGEPPCHHGLLGSADCFIHLPEQVAEIRRRFADAVQCVDMEGAAIAHVCTRFGTPFLILRALSDVPARGPNAPDFRTFLRQAAAHSAELCRDLVARLARFPDRDG